MRTQSCGFWSSLNEVDGSAQTNIKAHVHAKTSVFYLGPACDEIGGSDALLLAFIDGSQHPAQHRIQA